VEADQEAAFVGAFQLVLLEAEDGPAAGAEGAVDEAVAGAVGGNLLSPEGGVGFRLRGVERAAVPEATVDAMVAVACFPSMASAERFEWLTPTMQPLSRELGMVRRLKSFGLHLL
jgi:hypothetical protein